MFETTRMPLQSDVFAAITVVDAKDPYCHHHHHHHHHHYHHYHLIPLPSCKTNWWQVPLSYMYICSVHVHLVVENHKYSSN